MEKMLVSGFWAFKSNCSNFIQHPASSIQHLAHFGIKVRFQDFVNFK